MKTLRIRILGNGGCLNNGLAYHAFLMNDDFLIECPPDIMPTMKQLDIDISRVDSLYISHLHCDHTFGFPFFAINRWVESLNTELEPVTVYGPPGTEKRLRTLVALAFEAEHPCVLWSKDAFRFFEINEQSELQYRGLIGSCFLLAHLKYTYGLRFRNAAGKNVFTYIADTKWCDRVEDVLREHPRVVIADMNGGNPDFHMSVDDFISRGAALAGPETRFFGSHLADEFSEQFGTISCATVGTEIEVSV